MDFIEGFFLFFIALVVGLVFSLVQALFVWFIFSIVGIDFLDALSYWQVYGLTAAVSIMTIHTSTSSSS